jgi:hypothetical protein
MSRKNLPKVKTFLFLFLFLFSYVETADSFVHSRNEAGLKLKWPTTKPNVKFHFFQESNTFNTEAERNALRVIMDDSIAQWDDVGLLNISYELNYSNSRARGRNDIYFDCASNCELLDSNVLGVTQVVFENATGHIVETDIILNDTIGLNAIPNETFYIGNVLTHELGHALGMGHSEAGHASMFYLATNGQFEISPDEVAGYHTLYRTNSSVSTIKGQVIGGDDNSPLFGVHVILIDVGSGELAATTISDEVGYFEIRGVDPNKDYSILTSPIRNPSVLPGYFADVRNDYCIGRQQIKKSFWQGCGASDEGHPVKVNVDSGQTLNLGRVSVRCNIETPVAYNLNRDSGYNLDLSDYSNSFVGYKTLNDIKLSSFDIVNIDLSTEILPAVNSGEQLYLEVSLSTQQLYSMIRLRTKVVFADYSEATFGLTDLLTGDHTAKSDVTFRLNLDSGLSDDNSFEFQIAGKNFATTTFGNTVLNGYINDSNLAATLEDFFPDYSNLAEDSFFYLFNARIVKRLTNGSYENLGYVNNSYQKYDNGFCADAPLSYRTFPKVVANASQETGTIEMNQEDGLTDALGGCGTISPPGSGPGGGNMMFIFSLVLGLLLSGLFGSKYNEF